MKRTLFKTLLFLLSITSFSNALLAQQFKYHRIEAKINQDKFQNLMDAGLDIDHFHYHDGHLIAEVSDQDIRLIKSKNVKFTYLIKDIEKNIHKHNAIIDRENAKTEKTRAVTVPTPVNFGTGGNYGASGAVAKHFTFQDMQNELDAMRALYPNLITIKSSIGTTLEGRSVFMVRLSDNADTDENEPEVLLNAVHHAREPISMTQLIFFMWHLLENYATDKEIQTLVNSTEMYIVPCVNPDGYVYNQTTNTTGGGMWRKNRRNNGNGTFGVDDNRNYAYGWGGSGSSGTTSSDTYRGTAPFSENETQAIRNLCNSRQFVSGFNYHSYGNYCIYPYSNVAVNNNPEIPMFTQLSNFLTTDNGFVSGNAQATVNYIASGGAEDWSYGEQTTKGKMYSFTPEIGTSSDGFWPAASRIIPLCNSMIVMNKNMIKVSTKFATVTTTQAATLTSLNGTVPFSIKSFCVNPGSYTVTLNPLSPLVTAVDAPKVFNGMTIFQTLNDTFNFTLDSTITGGTSVSFEVLTDNGMHIRKDTIDIQFVCPAPGGLLSSNISTSSADVTWTALSGTTDYYVSYKTAASSTWGSDVLVNGSTTTLSGLNSNTAYNWRVRGDNCTSYSSTQNFTTLQVCGNAAPSASSITSSGFTLSWAAVGSATSYDVNSRLLGDTVWTNNNVTSTSRVFTGLSASTTYEYQVRANCPSGSGPYSAIQNVTTAAAGPTYCACYSTNNSSEWIDYIKLGSITRSSNKETGGYINTGLSTNLIRGTSNTMTFSAGFPGGARKENWRVYIDYNNDGDFSDAGESVINTNKNGSGNYTASFTVSSSVSLGTKRMRVIMKRNSISSACGSYSNGEVEDYTVNIVTSLNKTEPLTDIAQLEPLNVEAIPNPFMESINVHLYDGNPTLGARITLTNMQGQVVYKANLNAEEVSHQINTANLPTGIYFLQVIQGDRRRVLKMLK